MMVVGGDRTFKVLYIYKDVRVYLMIMCARDTLKYKRMFQLIGHPIVIRGR